MSLENRYIASIKLLAIADALGWITEGKKEREKVKACCGVEIIDRFYSWQARQTRFNDSIGNISSGSYSDMTQLLLSTARSITQNGACDYDYFAKQELIAWSLYKQGAGRTTSTAAISISRRKAQWNGNFFTVKQKGRDYRDCGANGAAMRILPITLVNVNNSAQMREQIFGNSIVTHGHPRALMGALLYGHMIESVLKTKKSNFSSNEFLKEIKNGLEGLSKLPFLSEPKYLEWLKVWNENNKNVDFHDLYSTTLTETTRKLEVLTNNLQNNIDVEQTFTDLGCYEKGKKHYGTSTVLAGLYIFCKYLDNPMDGLATAINTLGTDTKTIAVFAAGLFGALFGTSIIPQHLRDVQDASYLESVAKKLYRISQGEKIEVHKHQVNTFCLKDLSQIQDSNYSIGESIFYSPLGNGTIGSITLKHSDWGGGKKDRIHIGVNFDIGQSVILTKLINKPQSI